MCLRGVYPMTITNTVTVKLDMSIIELVFAVFLSSSTNTSSHVAVS